MTGIRAGIILQAISAATVALIFGFIASWKLTLVVLCYSPIMILSGKIRVRKAPESAKSKDKNSFVEQGGQVLNKRHYLVFFVYEFIHFSMQHKRLNTFVLLSLFIKKIILSIFMNMHSIKNSSNTFRYTFISTNHFIHLENKDIRHIC